MFIVKNYVIVRCTIARTSTYNKIKYLHNQAATVLRFVCVLLFKVNGNMIYNLGTKHFLCLSPTSTLLFYSCPLMCYRSGIV